MPQAENFLTEEKLRQAGNFLLEAKLRQAGNLFDESKITADGEFFGGSLQKDMPYVLSDDSSNVSCWRRVMQRKAADIDGKYL